MSLGEDASSERREKALGLARKAAERLFAALSAKGLRASFAESCTGGLLSALFTELPGSSALLWGSFIVYTVEAKEALLGVSKACLERWGPVSAQTAREMVQGALARSGADIAVAVTGYAGPEAPAEENGPGRVVIAWAVKDGAEASIEEQRFPGERAEVRLAAAARAFDGARRALHMAGRTNNTSY